MLIKNLFLVLISIFLLACNNQVGEGPNDYISEIKALNTDELKKQYLEKIYTADQSVRGDESGELMTKFGEDSKEYRAYIEEQWRIDGINLYKVEKYIEFHGYPSTKMGYKATTAPWIVIHHAQGYDTRERNFEEVYKAYLKEDINDTAISFYLGRMYEMKYKERLQMESPFMPEDEINLLIKELGLKDKQKKIEKELLQNS